MPRQLKAMILVLLCAAPLLSQPKAKLLVKNVNLVGLAGEADQIGRDVLVIGEKISAVRAASNNPIEAEQIIDGAGKWLIPGLIDMQVRLEYTEATAAARQKDLSELLSYGITTVVDLSGGASAEKNPETRLAPRVFRVAPPLRGHAVEWSTVAGFVIKNEKEARTAVQSAKQSGATMIYLDANLESGAVKGALHEAATHNLITACAALASSFEEAGRGGVNVIYGMTSLLSAFAEGGERKRFAEAWSRDDAALLAPALSADFFKAWQKVEPQKGARKKLQLLANQAVFFAPSLALETKRLLEYTQSARARDAQKLQEKYQQLLRLAFDLQIPLLAGSGYNANQYWRPLLHEELEAWVAAGIDPRFALEAATINAGHALRQSNLGQIAEGMRADIILLEEHPLKNLTSLRRPWAVIANGEFLSHEQLAQLRDENRVAERDIRAVLAWQVRAWNDGDLERFMRGYWKNDSTVFASGGNVSKGWQEMLVRYQRGYPTREKMGLLQFRIFKLDLMAENWAKVLGEWKLTVGTTMPQGLFTLILRRFGKEWRVVHDHTSSAAPSN